MMPSEDYKLAGRVLDDRILKLLNRRQLQIAARWAMQQPVMLELFYRLRGSDFMLQRLREQSDLEFRSLTTETAYRMRDQGANETEILMSQGVSMNLQGYGLLSEPDWGNLVPRWKDFPVPSMEDEEQDLDHLNSPQQKIFSRLSRNYIALRAWQEHQGTDLDLKLIQEFGVKFLPDQILLRLAEEYEKFDRELSRELEPFPRVLRLRYLITLVRKLAKEKWTKDPIDWMDEMSMVTAEWCSEHPEEKERVSLMRLMRENPRQSHLISRYMDLLSMNGFQTVPDAILISTGLLPMEAIGKESEETLMLLRH